MYPRQTLIALLLAAWAGLAGAAELAATIIFASGSPRLIAVDHRERPAAQGGELYSGETVDTRDGRVQLRFRDGASMSLQPATRFRVDDYVFAGEQGRAAAGDRGFFSLLRGGFRTLTGLIGKEKREQYRVSTSVATIGIRGTSYSANVDDSGLSLRTHSGRVAVCNSGGCVEVAPGEATHVSRPDEKPRLQTLLEAGGENAMPSLPVPPPSLDTSPPVGAQPQVPPAPPASSPPTAPASATGGPLGTQHPPASTGPLR